MGELEESSLDGIRSLADNLLPEIGPDYYYADIISVNFTIEEPEPTQEPEPAQEPEPTQKPEQTANKPIIITMIMIIASLIILFILLLFLYYHFK